jgi:drug/metabolite transporter (DMT)-like permease
VSESPPGRLAAFLDQLRRVVFGEPFTSWHVAAAALVLAGLALHAFGAPGAARR